MDLLLPSVFLLSILLFLRYKTGAKVYNLFGIGILLFLAFEFATSTPMIITFVGWIIYQLYDTFSNPN